MISTDIGENLEAAESSIPGGFSIRDMEAWEKIFVYRKDIPEIVRFLVSQMGDENE